MIVMGMLGPGFWLGIGARVAVAPATDFWETIGRRAPASDTPAALVAEDKQDEMAVSHKAAA